MASPKRIRILTVLVILALAAGVGAGVYQATRPKPDPPPPPNIVILMVDTLRADHLGVYGYQRNTSPFLDEFARENVQFNRAYTTAPWTKPAVASLFTSLRPGVHLAQRGQRENLFDGHGNMRIGADITIDALGDNLETMAERFQSMGYNTYGWTANMQVQGFIGFDQGFDIYRDKLTSAADADILNASALEVLSATSEKPFFAYLHYMDVHAPYEAPMPYDARFDYREDRPELDYDLVLFRENPEENVRGFWTVKREESAVLGYHVDRYDAEIKYWDSMARRFMAYLDWLGHLDNTVVVVVSDHGEEWMEHGGLEHGFTLYEEMIHIPLVMHFPDRYGFHHLRIQQPVEIIDVLPTLLDLVEAPRSARYDMQGKSLLPLLRAAREGTPPRAGEEVDPNVYAEMVWRGEKEMVSDGRYKLIRNEGRSFEFYDLHADPNETRNRYSEWNRDPPGEAGEAGDQDARPSDYRQRLDTAELMDYKMRQNMKQERGQVRPTKEFEEEAKALSYVGD